MSAISQWSKVLYLAKPKLVNVFDLRLFLLQAKAMGRVLFEQVCKQLHLLEADYFGLEYQDLAGTRVSWSTRKFDKTYRHTFSMSGSSPCAHLIKYNIPVLLKFILKILLTLLFVHCFSSFSKKMISLSNSCWECVRTTMKTDISDWFERKTINWLTTFLGIPAQICPNCFY